MHSHLQEAPESWVIEVSPGDKYEGGAQAKTTATATTMPENSDLIG